MADAGYVACFDGVGFLDRGWAGESCGAGRVGLELSGADAADRARIALCAFHVARRADFPGELFALFGNHAAKLVALEKSEAGRWNFIILISCRRCCLRRWWERCCCCSCRATAKTRIASSAICSLSLD